MIVWPGVPEFGPPYGPASDTAVDSDNRSETEYMSLEAIHIRMHCTTLVSILRCMLCKGWDTSLSTIYTSGCTLFFTWLDN